MIIIIAFIVLIAVLFILIKIKRLPLDSIVMVNGAVGSGKTSTCVYLAIKSHKKNVRMYKIRKFLHLRVEKEPPLLYSNIPLFNIDYVPLTTDLLLRKKRFNFKSIILISESSLIANSMNGRDKDFPHFRLTNFLKLIRHELHGTYARVPNIITETQSINDNHFAFDRCITQSLFLVRKINLPFFRIVKAKELLITDISTKMVNTYDSDIDNENFKWYIIPKKVFKTYDSYAYKILTDNLNKVSETVCYKSFVDFEIPTLTHNEEIIEHNKNYLKGCEINESKQEI